MKEEEKYIGAVTLDLEEIYKNSILYIRNILNEREEENEELNQKLIQINKMLKKI